MLSLHMRSTVSRELQWLGWLQRGVGEEEEEEEEGGYVVSGCTVHSAGSIGEPGEEENTF